MNVNRDLALYDLESYLFDDVSVRYQRGDDISAFDFFCIIIWKANRAKSKIAKKLMEHGKANLETSVQMLLQDLRTAKEAGDEHGKARMEVLFCKWRFWLPMASAILTVLYPEEFTVYDIRACEQLGGDHEKAGNTSKFEVMWPGYLAFKAAVEAQGEKEMSLRDKDRMLWARSFSGQLKGDIEAGFDKVRRFLMRLPQMPHTELVGLLARAYAADHGKPRKAPDAAERTALADYLGCHEEVRDAVFAVWCQGLDGVTEVEAKDWLAMEFITPCPEGGVPSGNDALEQRATSILRDGQE